MKHLDEKLRQMARAEDTPVPEGFDERLEERLSSLPGGRRRLSRGVRTALIAACLCAAVGSAAATVLWGVFTDGQVKTSEGGGLGYDFLVEGMTKFPVDILGEDVLNAAKEQYHAVG